MTRLALIAIVIAACGPVPDAEYDTRAGNRADGSRGAVCAWGTDVETHRASMAPMPCHTDLVCCGNSGIDGSPSICATHAQCASWAGRP